MSTRLTRNRLAALELPLAGVTGPQVDPADLAVGIVHFGVGAFHRAHQAIFTEDACAATGDCRWGILGVTGRSDHVVRQLKPQDCLYGVLLRDADDARLRLVGSVRDVAWPAEASDRIAAAVAAPSAHLATLTITEKGYCRGQNGDIDLTLDNVRHDVAVIATELSGGDPDVADRPSKTPLGLLVRGLVRRFRGCADPFSVVSCDNLSDNGKVVGRIVHSLVAAAASEAHAEPVATRFRQWLDTSVTFPSTMVDRITPATTEADKTLAERMLGLHDDALVVAEPFAQWVIEDKFAGPRPAWEKVGAIITNDVAPYERVKLRILNAAHSMFAYLGVLRGHETIAEAVTDPVLRDVVVRTLDEDILPTLVAPAGVDLQQYRGTVLRRFANPALAHTTLQVAMDGSQKLPVRILGTVVDRCASGHIPKGLALAVAAWIVFVAATGEPEGPPLNDPLAAMLHATIPSRKRLYSDPRAIVESVFALERVFPPALRADNVFAGAVMAQLGEVRLLTACDA